MRTVSVLASLLIFFGGCECGDNHGGDVDAAEGDASIDASIDGSPPDANCPARLQGVVGGPCTTDTQCDSSAGAADGICLTAALGGIGWPAEGYCITKYDGCTTDADCGDGNTCITIDDPKGAFSACLPACGSGTCACPNNQVCADNLAGSEMNKTACIPGNQAARDGDPCSGFGECDVNSICRNDPAEYPNGQCMQVGCTIGNDATCTSGGDGHCADPGFVSAGAGCLDRCVVDSDCRQADGYKCFDGGAATGKYCRHPQTGDACTTEADCGDPALWDCRTGAGFPGGYCTLRQACNATNGTGCSPGSSVCYDPPGTAEPYCVDRCTGAAQGTCRTGYACTPVPQPGGESPGACI